ncbi:MAG: T9SS type A sorting domain-containing protein [Tannerellaceae bacterium]|jgi:hypothetical protein|nr:T9SS type A sorting domain-containing protein [Tannerellaceae bacterium]
MKKIFIITSLIFYCLQLQAQCYDFYVKTPNNSNIKACSSGGYSSSQVQQADTYSRTFAIQVFDSGTNSYNCHGYAWNKKEGGSSVWINNLGSELNNLSTYWTDNSYYAYSGNMDNLKVFYGNDDHTAVTTSDPNVFISKMGCGCLVSHNKNNSPYAGGNLTYYRKNPPSISGPSAICSGSSGTFTVSRAPASYTWSKSSNLTQSSTSGNTATFTANGTGPAWVKIMESGTEVSSRTVYIGILQTADFSGSCGGPESGSTNLFFGSASSSYSVSEFEWGVAPGWSVVSHPNFPSATIPMGNVRITRNSSSAVTTTPVWIRARNSCGWSNEKALGTITSSSVYTVSVYPNPVLDVLNVLIEKEEAALTQSETTGASVSGTVGRVTPVYTIRLYNLMTGVQVLQTSANEAETIQLNVGSLPNGIYVLQVHDGTDNPPVTQRIVVSH